jgi:gliding motility-associated-like protein
MKKAFIFAFTLLISEITTGQLNKGFNGLSANLAPISNSANSEKTEPIWTESIQERTIFSSSFLSNDGQIKIIQSKRPINYFSTTNILVPIDSKLSQLTNDVWAALDQPSPTYFYKDASFSVTVANQETFTLGKNCKINNQSIHTKFEFNGNSITLSEVIPGIDKQLIFAENAIKYNYILHHPLSDIQNSCVFSEELDLPKGYKIIKDVNYGEQTNYGWNGNLLIVDVNKNVVSTLHLPICYDSNKDVVSASYVIKEEDDKVILEIVVPSDWLNNKNRAYPIIIDPIVTGPTANWSGGNMPSCIMPSYNKDSIQVTIPAGITITGLFVTASFYADPFTAATMSQGAMKFSTSCATSQSFTITGAPGTVAGTAYLDYYNLFSPLTCCFPESCNSSTFYLTMQLGRTGPGTGCNQTYIRYDPIQSFPSYPFQAVIVGKTAETYGAQWTVPAAPICSNTCTINGTGFVQYGVAPYTFSHPWSSQVVTQGTNSGCNAGSTNFNFTMTIPNCPIFCDSTYTTLSVPPPTIIDACGNLVTGMLNEIVPIKMAPLVSPSYDSLVCSGIPYTVAMNTCPTAAITSWAGNSGSGNTDITQEVTNSGTTNQLINYFASASYNNCYSDTVSIPVYIQPLPIANYSYSPDPVIAQIPVVFSDGSQINSGIITDWNWSFGDTSTSTNQNPTYTYNTPGAYNVCLTLTNDNGCQDSICQLINVLPVDVTAPNIVTPNNDGVNDLLEFAYLQFYQDTELSIYNRWGNLMYQKEGYLNDWNGSDFNEGTYFFVLKIKEVDKVYTGFFQLVK